MPCEVVATRVMLLDVVLPRLRTQLPPFEVRYLQNFTGQHVGLFLLKGFAVLLRKEQEGRERSFGCCDGDWGVGLLEHGLTKLNIGLSAARVLPLLHLFVNPRGFPNRE